VDLLDYQNIMPIAFAITTFGGAWLTIRKIAKDAAKSKKEQAAEILHAAKEEDSLMRAKLEARIESVKAELANLQLNVNKDLSFLKESHSNEIKNLGVRIESLRDELRLQHSQLLSLLTKLIDN
jgi:hypothetical protein